MESRLWDGEYKRSTVTGRDCTFSPKDPYSLLLPYLAHLHRRRDLLGLDVTRELSGRNSFESTLAVPRGNLYPSGLRYLPAPNAHARTQLALAARCARRKRCERSGREGRARGVGAAGRSAAARGARSLGRS